MCLDSIYSHATLSVQRNLLSSGGENNKLLSLDNILHILQSKLHSFALSVVIINIKTIKCLELVYFDVNDVNNTKQFH